MLGAIDYEDEHGLIRFLEISTLDEKTRERAGAKFLSFKAKGVIINKSYDDEIWVLRDDLETFRLKFCFDSVQFMKYAEPWLEFGLDEYVEYCKAFAALCLGNVVLATIREAVNAMRILAKTPYDELPLRLDSSPISSFLLLLPKNNLQTEELMEILDHEARKKAKRHPRQLLPFRDYIQFNNVIVDFWEGADKEEKLHYFPVYLWWMLTTTLPLRAKEFLLIPRNCLGTKNGIDTITVRRTILKKKPQNISYRLSHDYELHRYEIPEWMVSDIRWYLKNTEGRKLSDAGLLFIPENARSRYFSYETMRNRLKEFCETVGYKDGKIHMGDTRHLAMINLILSGGSPSVCRELAGHEDIDISSNYYANISEIVKEAVYDYSRRNGKGAFMTGRQFYPTVIPDKSVRLNNGWCGSEYMANGRIDSCIKTFSEEGGIGDCRHCPYFYPDDPGVRLEMEQERQKAVDEDGVFLMQMIELVRKGNGSEESIRTAISRLQNTSRDYGNLLYRRYQEVYANGENREA